MTVTTTTWAALHVVKNQLIRKSLEGSVFTAPFDADPITVLTDGAGADLVQFPDGWGDVGLMNNDGAQFARQIETSLVTSWGYVEPTRSDITKDSTTLKISAQETKLQTIGLRLGIDTSTLTADATTGELQVAAPQTPAQLFYRTMTVAVDLTDDGEIYIGRFMPKGQVTGFDDEKMGQGDDPLMSGVTFTGLFDATLGFAHKYFWGGPGWKALLDDMGIPTA